MSKTARSNKTVPRPGSTEPIGKRESRVYRNRELCDAIASLEWCSVCGTVGHVTHCHDNRQKYGKGRGIKASDAAQFAGCSACHSMIDNGKSARAVNNRLSDYGIAQTYRYMIGHGLIGGFFIEPCASLADIAEAYVHAIESGALKLKENWRKL